MEKQIKQKRAVDLGNDPVGPLLLRLALPTICAQVVNLLYNIVDRIYIGQIPVEGKLALTGMGVTFPVITLISAFAALIGMSGKKVVVHYVCMYAAFFKFFFQPHRLVETVF